MESLLKASQNFENINDFDEKVFLEFMKQVTIWEYYGLSKDNYLALPEPEKRAKISQYYLEMKSKGAGECFYFLFFCLICLKMVDSVLTSLTPVNKVRYSIYSTNPD